MNPSTFETTDIYKGAYFLCENTELKEVRFELNGNQTASFLFTGPNLQTHDKNYKTGLARVNPVQFRAELNHLRDLMFKRLRDNKIRGERNDRSENNRYHQIRR